MKLSVLQHRHQFLSLSGLQVTQGSKVTKVPKVTACRVTPETRGQMVNQFVYFCGRHAFASVLLHLCKAGSKEVKCAADAPWNCCLIVIDNVHLYNRSAWTSRKSLQRTAGAAWREGPHGSAGAQGPRGSPRISRGLPHFWVCSVEWPQRGPSASTAEAEESPVEEKINTALQNWFLYCSCVIVGMNFSTNPN